MRQGHRIGCVWIQVGVLRVVEEVWVFDGGGLVKVQRLLLFSQLWCVFSRVCAFGTES